MDRSDLLVPFPDEVIRHGYDLASYAPVHLYRIYFPVICSWVFILLHPVDI